MNKKILLLGLIVFIALFTMSYVTATAEITGDVEFEDLKEGSIDQYKDIQVSNEEEKVLKEGKTITKKVNIVKEVKKYGKSKTSTIKTPVLYKKSVMKKQIKKAFNGKSAFSDMNDKFKGSKLIKISLKNIKVKNKKCLKITVKYQPVKMVKVYKSTMTSIKLNKWGDVEFKYVNPFNGKKETEYGGIVYY